MGSVPIVLQGFPIGTLILGDCLDQHYVEELRDSFDGEVVLTMDGRILHSTFPDVTAALPQALPFPGVKTPDKGATLRIENEDYILAPMCRGGNESGGSVNLYLLHCFRNILG